MVKHLCRLYGWKTSLSKVNDIIKRGKEVGCFFGHVCLLSYLDSALYAYHQAALWLTEERAEVRMGTRALRGCENIEGNVDGCPNTPKGSLWKGVPDLCDGRHESDRIQGKCSGQMY